MAEISEKSRISVPVVASFLGLAFSCGLLYANQLHLATEVAEVKKVQAGQMQRMAEDLAKVGAKLDLLLLLEPRDQQKARGRP